MLVVVVVVGLFFYLTASGRLQGLQAGRKEGQDGTSNTNENATSSRFGRVQRSVGLSSICLLCVKSTTHRALAPHRLTRASSLQRRPQVTEALVLLLALSPSLYPSLLPSMILLLRLSSPSKDHIGILPFPVLSCASFPLFPFPLTTFLLAFPLLPLTPLYLFLFPPSLSVLSVNPHPLPYPYIPSINIVVLCTTLYHRPSSPLVLSLSPRFAVTPTSLEAHWFPLPCHPKTPSSPFIL